MNKKEIKEKVLKKLCRHYRDDNLSLIKSETSLYNEFEVKRAIDLTIQEYKKRVLDVLWEHISDEDEREEIKKELEIDGK